MNWEEHHGRIDLCNNEGEFLGAVEPKTVDGVVVYDTLDEGTFSTLDDAKAAIVAYWRSYAQGMLRELDALEGEG